MRRWVWVRAAALMAAAFPLAGASLSVATYNVQNYTRTDRVVEGEYQKDYPKPETEKEALRRVIVALDVDLLVLQEMGGRAHLEELQRDLAADGCEYAVGEVLEAADADRMIAVLSRRELQVRKHTDLDFSYRGARERVKRGLLEVTVRISGRDLSFFIVHLKSRYTERKDDPQSAARRAGEATAARNRILERHPEPAQADFVVLGDFNESRIGAGVRYFLNRGPKVISLLLDAFDSRSESWTHHYGREDTYTRVDHILVSHRLFGHVRDGRAFIADGPGVREASDHRPVRLVLQDL